MVARSTGSQLPTKAIIMRLPTILIAGAGRPGLESLGLSSDGDGVWFPVHRSPGIHDARHLVPCASTETCKLLCACAARTIGAKETGSINHLPLRSTPALAIVFDVLARQNPLPLGLILLDPVCPNPGPLVEDCNICSHKPACAAILSVDNFDAGDTNGFNECEGGPPTFGLVLARMAPCIRISIQAP